MRRLGLDLGGTNIKLALLDGDQLVARSPRRRRARTRAARRPCSSAWSSSRAPAGEVDSVGVALPGLFDGDGRALLLPNLSRRLARRARSAAPLSAALGRAGAR